ncbi:glycosyltransferase family 2 protein [Leptospira sp. GIMC2001]|uniref:glycosyltransferase family 2 protein n=1 Tax=Leptospira sp. GIMC2001 TaxID=1513297 RepID=UPI0023490932|nr:glycosyltransferase family 2 protein [Leptospira sp. GIMC2001]WCL50284.1 glycosyltransferase family 2 protein [Leptospira sp. GIMC2001]
MKTSYWIIIPALNEEKNIKNLLIDLQNIQYPPEKIIISDNGSVDKTAEIAKQYGAIVVYEKKKGYGSACLRALQYVEDSIRKPSIIVFMDADRSDDPTEIRDLISPIDTGEVDVTIGSRTLGIAEIGSLSFVQKFGNKLSCFLLKFIYNIKFTDLGPFRAIRYTSLEKLKMSDPDFGWTVEMQAKIAMLNIPYREIPVNYRKRKEGESKVSGNLKGSFLAGKKILSTIFSLAISKFFIEWKTYPNVRFIALLFTIIALVSFTDKSTTIAIFLLGILGFLLIPYKYIYTKNIGIYLIFTGIVLRIPTLFIEPNWSEDYYRILWDAILVGDCVSPYLHAPMEIVNQFGDFQFLIQKMNSADYFSFYPPIQHFLGMISLSSMRWFGNNNLESNLFIFSLFLKLILLFFEIGNLILFRIILQRNSNFIIFYAWNPMVIMETTGNIHLETVMLFFILLTIILWQKAQYSLAGFSFGLAIWTKLIPIIFIPFIYFRNCRNFRNSFTFNWRININFFAPSFIFIILWLYLISDGLLSQFELGIGLYSSYFEFFSSMNYLLKYFLASWNIQYAQTGIIIWIIFGIFLILLSFQFAKTAYRNRKEISLPRGFLYVYNLLLLLSPVIHPWYLIPWLGLGIINSRIYPFVGSFFILFSYSYYSSIPYVRNEEIVWTSYILFFIFYIWEKNEYKFNRNSIRSPRSSIRNLH